MSPFDNHDLSVLVAKLSSIATLSKIERDAVLGLPSTCRVVDRNQDIAREGERPSECCVVLSGWAYRYKILDRGERQILSFHVAGEIPDLQSLHLPVMDHTLATLTTCRLAMIPHDRLHALTREHPELAALLWRYTLIDAAIFREGMTRIGCRETLGRVAHLFCEIYWRLEALGLAADYACEFPLNQIDLADAIGVSGVHINRVLKELRGRGLITLQGRRLVIHEWSMLIKIARFDPTYLHLRRTPAA